MTETTNTSSTAISPSDGPVAVTGASGYIGSWIVHDLMEQGYSVRDISELVGKGQRQIRGVQERLKDMALAS